MHSEDVAVKPSGQPQSGKKGKERFSHYVSVHGDGSIRVDKLITIERPVGEVYSFWRRLENLPRFMRHLKSVTVQDELHSHWAVRTVGKKALEWDAEIIAQRENEMISWRSTPGAELANAGSVWFTPTPSGNATMVRVELMYQPTGGKSEAFAAKLLGRDAGSEIEADLRRLKSLLEGDEVADGPTPQNWQSVEDTEQIAELADNYVREHPWGFVATVGVFGFVVGLILGRFGSRNR